MSDASLHHGRALHTHEKALLVALLGSSFNDIDLVLNRSLVEDMSDGGMGSIRFLHQSGKSRSFGRVQAEAEYVDADGVIISIVVNLDDQGDLYEIDFWKVDFSPLREYPSPEQLRIKSIGKT